MRNPLTGCIVAMAVALLGTTAASAQLKTKEEILRRLTGDGQPATRSFGTRGIDMVEPIELGKSAVSEGLAGVRPPETQQRQIDLYVTFKVNSHELTPDAQRQLRELGDALSDNAMADNRVRIAGHTDASGSADYNLQLSRRRAEEVRDFLWRNFRIDPARLETVGYGKERLLNPAAPNSIENRRVEIINLDG